MTNEPKRLPPEALDAWLERAARTLHLDRAEVPIPLILDVAADVAHGVARPAAPLSTFLLGLALGRRSSEGATLETLAADLSVLAETWEVDQESAN
ncbi:DUF6457 domain-containing protein [Leucobacter denitrificans]|uniref:DUF6457 domain-containing protein n=1 Tax=Leucobacter denitrificans TaxID=683042 RepID=A0A7G9S418_9MICO|nr:DUF6457 domain-containing protein [Leucobacter denitrificans]QNN62593.1 hypothetical protein H9L06_10190 [Leucobacter denitrificans]